MIDESFEEMLASTMYIVLGLGTEFAAYCAVKSGDRFARDMLGKAQYQSQYLNYGAPRVSSYKGEEEA